MVDRLQNAFAAVKAEEALKEKTLAAVSRRAGKRRIRPLRWAAAAVCLVLLLGLGGGLFFTPVSAISVDINPSLELSINRFDRVIGVEGYNERGKELAQSAGLLFADYSQALDILLASEGIRECLERGEALSIFVACDDPQRSGEMLQKVETCAGNGRGIHCHAGNMADSAAAHAAGLSCGKYRAFLELQALDPTATPEDVQGLTMREIRRRIAELSGEAVSGQDFESGCGHGEGCRHRHGQGG